MLGRSNPTSASDAAMEKLRYNTRRRLLRSAVICRMVAAWVAAAAAVIIVVVLQLAIYSKDEGDAEPEKQATVERFKGTWTSRCAVYALCSLVVGLMACRLSFTLGRDHEARNVDLDRRKERKAVSCFGVILIFIGLFELLLAVASLNESVAVAGTTGGEDGDDLKSAMASLGFCIACVFLLLLELVVLVILFAHVRRLGRPLYTSVTQTSTPHSVNRVDRIKSDAAITTSTSSNTTTPWLRCSGAKRDVARSKNKNHNHHAVRAYRDDDHDDDHLECFVQPPIQLLQSTVSAAAAAGSGDGACSAKRGDNSSSPLFLVEEARVAVGGSGDGGGDSSGAQGAQNRRASRSPQTTTTFRSPILDPTMSVEEVPAERPVVDELPEPRVTPALPSDAPASTVFSLPSACPPSTAQSSLPASSSERQAANVAGVGDARGRRLRNVAPPTLPAVSNHAKDQPAAAPPPSNGDAGLTPSGASPVTAERSRAAEPAPTPRTPRFARFERSPSLRRGASARRRRSPSPASPTSPPRTPLFPRYESTRFEYYNPDAGTFELPSDDSDTAPEAPRQPIANKA